MNTRSNYYYDHYEGLFYDDGMVFEDPDFAGCNYEGQRELMAMNEGRVEGCLQEKTFEIEPRTTQKTSLQAIITSHSEVLRSHATSGSLHVRYECNPRCRGQDY
jgi:hypothetical protein